MVKFNNDVDPSEIRRLLKYDPETGRLFWRKSRQGVSAGIAGTVTQKGYVHVQINGCVYAAHRVAWAHHFGEWPEGILDHINRDGLDNRISNLRLACYSLNGLNRKRSSNNTSGVTGVYWDRSKEKWRARITIGGRVRHLGCFGNKLDAARAYSDAKRELMSKIHGGQVA